MALCKRHYWKIGVPHPKSPSGLRAFLPSLVPNIAKTALASVTNFALSTWKVYLKTLFLHHSHRGITGKCRKGKRSPQILQHKKPMFSIIGGGAVFPSCHFSLVVPPSTQCDRHFNAFGKFHNHHSSLCEAMLQSASFAFHNAF